MKHLRQLFSSRNLQWYNRLRKLPVRYNRGDL
jgi:hypothetical protein